MLMCLKGRDPVLDFVSDVALQKYPGRRHLECRDTRPLDALDRLEQYRWFARSCDGIRRKDGIFSSVGLNRQRLSRNLRPSSRYESVARSTSASIPNA